MKRRRIRNRQDAINYLSSIGVDTIYVRGNVISIIDRQKKAYSGRSVVQCARLHRNDHHVVKLVAKGHWIDRARRPQLLELLRRL